MPHISGIKQCLSFCVWLMLCKLHVFKVHSWCSRYQNSLLRLNNIPWSMYTAFWVSVHVVRGHLSCFHILPVVNEAAVNTGVQKTCSSLWFQSLWVHPQKWNRCIICWLYVQFLAELVYSLPSWLHHFTFLIVDFFFLLPSGLNKVFMNLTFCLDQRVQLASVETAHGVCSGSSDL